jgi:phage/plasmid-associated DNA primase
MDKELFKLLKDNSVIDKNINPTHYTFYSTGATGGEGTKWEIDNSKLTEFWTSYCRLVENKPTSNLCLAELPTPFMPIISTLTLKFHDTNTDNVYYDTKFLKQIVYLFQEAIQEIFQINSDTNEELICVILERPLGVLDDDCVGFEIRLQFPYSRIDIRHAKLINDKIIKLLHKNNVLSKLNQTPIGDWQSIIDLTVSQPITMYGSCDQPLIDSKGNRTKVEKLNITHIWGIIYEYSFSDNSDDFEDNEDEDEMNIEEVFDISAHDQIRKGMVDENIVDEDIESWLPMFLSITFHDKLLILRKDSKVHERFTTGSKAGTDSTFGDPKTMDDNDEFLLCQKMISMLNVERFNRENFWLDIGKALYNIDKNTDKGLNLWIKSTSKALNNLKDFMLTEGSLESTCRTIFNSLNNTCITYKTLAWYAKEDNPEKYAEWHKEWCRASMETALNGIDTDLAEALYRVHWLEYVCPSLSPPRWFRFHDNKWTQNDSGVSLRIAISSTFRGTFEGARAQLNRKIAESTDEAYKAKAELINKKLNVLIAKLGTGKMKDAIMKEAKEKFHAPKFMSLLDKNPDLTGVVNGVLEIQGKDVIFRAAKPEDYITMSTSVKYEKLSYEHPLVKELLKWLGQTFTDEDLRHHFCKFAASLLIARNADKIFPVFTGEGGDNSKSMIVKLFECTMGVYSIKFPVAMLTEKFSSASGPNPQLARARGARIAFLDEPEDDVSLQKGTIKRYTGGDSFFARLLQENGGDVEATFKMVLVCNKVPIIPNADKAIKKRTRLFPFLSTWSMDAPKSEEEQMKQRLFKMDPNFEKRIPKLASAFLWLMTQYFHVYANEGLPDPQIITEYTENYWRDNDVYAQFAAEKIEVVYIDSDMTEKDTNVKLSLTELYQEFKDWYTINFPKVKIPQRSFVKSEYQHRWGKMVNNSWIGIKIAETEQSYNPIKIGHIANDAKKSKIKLIRPE